MNDLFSELYDAYRRQIQAAKRNNKPTPNMLWSISPEHVRVLLSAADAFQYFGQIPRRTIFDVPFVENGDQSSTWTLYILADRGPSSTPDESGHDQ